MLVLIFATVFILIPVLIFISSVLIFAAAAGRMFVPNVRGISKYVGVQVSASSFFNSHQNYDKKKRKTKSSVRLFRSLMSEKF